MSGLQNIQFSSTSVTGGKAPVEGFTYIQLSMLLDSLDQDLEVNKSLIVVLNYIKSSLVDAEKKQGGIK